VLTLPLGVAADNSVHYLVHFFSLDSFFFLLVLHFSQNGFEIFQGVFNSQFILFGQDKRLGDIFDPKILYGVQVTKKSLQRGIR
jgi:hypothetical protein